jgi:hypothetical protein
VQSEIWRQIGAGKFTPDAPLHWTSLGTAPQRGRSENNVRSPGDGPKAAYHPPSDRVKITYGDSLVTGDVRTLTLATVVRRALVSERRLGRVMVSVSGRVCLPEPSASPTPHSIYNHPLLPYIVFHRIAHSCHCLGHCLRDFISVRFICGIGMSRTQR